MTERVSMNVENGVADVKLTRGDKMNALDQAMFEGIIETGAKIAEDTSIRCVVLSGEGRAFCAGLDMGNFGKMADSGGNGGVGGRRSLADRTHGITNGPQQAVWTWRSCPVPVIAAVHGVAFGGGFQLTLGADIRIVHPETRLSILEIKWGLVPDMAGTAIMRGLARDDVIRELTYTGRQFSGDEAKDYGFATQVSETPYEAAMDLAREIAGKNPDAIRRDKAIFNSVFTMSDEDALLQESRMQDEVIGTPNQIESIMAAMEKRAANFSDG